MDNVTKTGSSNAGPSLFKLVRSLHWTRHKTLAGFVIQYLEMSDPVFFS